MNLLSKSYSVKFDKKRNSDSYSVTFVSDSVLNQLKKYY